MKQFLDVVGLVDIEGDSFVMHELYDGSSGLSLTDMPGKAASAKL